ncbi:N-acetyltransferase GCN5 [Cupriavidus necator]|uniref:N-acetyltransferase GCN5 n=1 Tax=Cupriavidus necator TaxID=106590 RepID=A0A1K0IBC2_CUPNE|nr:N-acetyltransferase GCN5 [Cupriavidus necator]
MPRDVRIRAAGIADIQAISEVLQQCGLSVENVRPAACLCHVAEFGEIVAGCACGEIFDQTFVIRTVGVLPDFRERRIATHLVAALLMRARANDCTKAVLLTTEHPAFFARYGFSLTSVDELPTELELSREFQRRFGAWTHCMCRRLD